MALEFLDLTLISITMAKAKPFSGIKDKAMPDHSHALSLPLEFVEGLQA